MSDIVGRNSAQRDFGVDLDDLLRAEGVDPTLVHRVELVVGGVAEKDRHRLEVWRLEAWRGRDGVKRLSVTLIDHADTPREWRQVARDRGPGRYRVCTKDGQLVSKFRFRG